MGSQSRPGTQGSMNQEGGLFCDYFTAPHAITKALRMDPVQLRGCTMVKATATHSCSREGTRSIICDRSWSGSALASVSSESVDALANAYSPVSK